MNVFGIALSVAVLMLPGCNSGQQLIASDISTINSYCAEGQAKTNIDMGKALIDRLTEITKEPLEREYKLMGVPADYIVNLYERFQKRIKTLKDNCGKWPKSFPGIQSELNARLQTPYG